MVPPQSRRIIGGEFELESLCFAPSAGLDGLTRGLAGSWTISGRSAFMQILSHLKAKGIAHVHLPAYLCESLLQPVRALGMDYSFYRVDRQLAAHPNPPPESAVLLIHYFGWINPATKELRARSADGFYLIEDPSQALLSDWSAPKSVERLVLLSMRKLGPVPLGGWCNVESSAAEPSIEAQAIMWRSIAARLAKGLYLANAEGEIDPATEEFYLSGFQAAESFLDGSVEIFSLPKIIKELLAGINWRKISERRRSNWQTLHDLLGGHVEAVHETLPCGVVPLGYVVRADSRDSLRASLAKRRIFCPVHWPMPAEIPQKSFAEAAENSRRFLTIPIDQRYGAEDMQHVANVIRQCY
jgi:hypothetical protein